MSNRRFGLIVFLPGVFCFLVAFGTKISNWQGGILDHQPDDPAATIVARIGLVALLLGYLAYRKLMRHKAASR